MQIKLVEHLKTYDGISKKTGKPYKQDTWLIDDMHSSMKATVFCNQETDTWKEGMVVEIKELKHYKDDMYNIVMPYIPKDNSIQVSLEDRVSTLEAKYKKINYLIDEIKNKIGA